MTPGDEALLLRIYLGEAVHATSGGPLYEAIVLAAREAGLAGATVLRGPLGYGHSSRLHTSSILRLSVDLPMVIEIVDERAKVEAFVPTVAALGRTGLVTVEPVTVISYGQPGRA